MQPGGLKIPMRLQDGVPLFVELCVRVQTYAFTREYSSKLYKYFLSQTISCQYVLVRGTLSRLFLRALGLFLFNPAFVEVLLAGMVSLRGQAASWGETYLHSLVLLSLFLTRLSGGSFMIDATDFVNKLLLVLVCVGSSRTMRLRLKAERIVS